MDGIRVEEKQSLRYVAAGTSAEAIAGIGAVVLTILALANILPVVLASISAIAIGAGLLFQGAGISSKFSGIVAEATDTPSDVEQLKGGLTVEFLGGIAGIVLGILSLIGLAQAILLPVTLIIFGATILIGSSTAAKLNAIRFQDRSNKVQQAAREMVRGSVGAQVLLGLGGITLGIISITTGQNILVFTLIGLLAMGASELLTGASLSTKLMSIFK